MHPLRKKFVDIYCNLSHEQREEIILDTDDFPNCPMTWNVVWIEVKADTALSKTILKKLNKLGII